MIPFFNAFTLDKFLGVIVIVILFFNVGIFGTYFCLKKGKSKKLTAYKKFLKVYWEGSRSGICVCVFFDFFG